jgi:hypothetical protein
MASTATTKPTLAQWQAHQARWQQTLAMHALIGFRPPDGLSWNDASARAQSTNAAAIERGGYQNATCINSRCGIPIMDGFALLCLCHLPGVTYCSVQCQKKDRKRHKAHCTAPVRPKAAPPAALCWNCADEPGTLKFDAIPGSCFCTLECMAQYGEMRDPESCMNAAIRQRWIEQKREGREQQQPPESTPDAAPEEVAALVTAAADQRDHESDLSQQEPQPSAATPPNP